jgi:hypothetical protein
LLREVFATVAAGNRADFERYDAKPFSAYPDRPSTNYFALPVEILERADDLTVWAQKSLRAGHRTPSVSMNRMQRPSVNFSSRLPIS